MSASFLRFSGSPLDTSDVTLVPRSGADWGCCSGVSSLAGGRQPGTELGQRALCGVFFSLTAITALSLLLGTFLYTHHAGATDDMATVLSLRDAPFLSGFSLPLGGMIVAFCMLNPELTLTFWYLFPIRAIWIAWIVALSTYFTAGMGPISTLFACGGIIAAFLYVKFGRSWADIGSYSAPAPDAARAGFARLPGGAALTPDDAGRVTQARAAGLRGRWKDWQERRRLEKTAAELRASRTRSRAGATTRSGGGDKKGLFDLPPEGHRLFLAGGFIPPARGAAAALRTDTGIVMKKHVGIAALGVLAAGLG